MKKKQTLNAILNRLNPLLLKWLKWIYYFSFSRYTLGSWRAYREADEDQKYQHILEAVNYLRVAGAGDTITSSYFEFGCHSGRTFSAAVNAANYLKMNNMDFFAFDSFEGLPETYQEDGYFEKGTFSTSERDFVKIIKSRTGHHLRADNIIKGFYEDTLTPTIYGNLPKIGVVHIDVDLYSSTVTVLEFIKPLLSDGSVILFDDWYCFPKGESGGEGLATKEFLQKHQDLSLIPWKNYSTFGKSFFVEIKKG